VRVIAVPVKSFDRAKTRLSELLSPMERAVLTLAMFEDVMDAVAGATTWTPWVVSKEEAILEVAATRGARPIPEAAAEPTLIAAIRQVEDLALPAGADALAVLLADLPLLTAEALETALRTVGPVVLGPSHSDGGTNLLIRRPPDAIPPRFGTRSDQRHREAARKAGLRTRSVRLDELAFDLDRLEDVTRLLASDSQGRTALACREMDLAARLRVPAGRAAGRTEDT
jgi:2-phospho-L-lactate guanylyltransferase